VRVIALDPGGTTGIVIWENGEIRGMHLGPAEHHAELYDLLDNERGIWWSEDTTIVCESFQYRNGLPKAELISCEYIGIVKLFAQTFGIKCYMQTPSMGKSWMTNPQLQAVGWLFKPATVSPYKHMNDAARHLAYYAMHNQRVPVELRAELLRKRSGL
jgi:hypothetical protein